MMKQTRLQTQSRLSRSTSFWSHQRCGASLKKVPWKGQEKQHPAFFFFWDEWGLKKQHPAFSFFWAEWGLKERQEKEVQDVVGSQGGQ